MHLLYYPGCDCSFCRGLPDKCHEWGGDLFWPFIVSLVAGAFASVVLRIVFINLSMQRKFGKFKRQVFVISNKDLLNSL